MTLARHSSHWKEWSHSKRVATPFWSQLYLFPLISLRAISQRWLCIDADAWVLMGPLGKSFMGLSLQRYVPPGRVMRRWDVITVDRASWTTRRNRTSVSVWRDTGANPANSVSFYSNTQTISYEQFLRICMITLGQRVRVFDFLCDVEIAWILLDIQCESAPINTMSNPLCTTSYQI